MRKPKKATMQLATEALVLGLECFSEGDVVPFVLLRDSAGKDHLIEVNSVDGVIDEHLVGSARDMIRGLGPGQNYALVYDGFLTTDGRGKKQDAVFTEVATRGDATAFIFAQKYKRRKREGVFLRDGEPLVLTETEHLWK